jgi:hypothetical protein
MSWDVIIMRFPEGFNDNFDNIQDEWEAEELFTQEFFSSEMKKLFPNINGEALDEETFSIEFYIGEDDPITCITLHVRGGDEAIKAIELICRRFDLQAFDTTKCKIIDFSKETNDGFTQWREYKNSVLKKEGSNESQKSQFRLFGNFMLSLHSLFKRI